VIIKILNFLLVILETYLVAGAEIKMPLSHLKQARKNKECQQKTHKGHGYVTVIIELIIYDWAF
jgi:hypothetical protein